ncbi:MAG TPA: SMP-30/gluconolactonase/LRE family protein [Marmoricola sp.]|nr:SMP-30/gluconolactonase/LRE family protein [Marmoricola sp.]
MSQPQSDRPRPLRRIQVPGNGAEDVLVDAEGKVWTGTEDGSIFRISPDGSKFEKVADTGGRPLGLELLPDGRILVCDARAGLLAVDEKGAVETLLREVDGVPMKFCNNAAVAANGDIWFSDSSTVYGIEDWKADFVENPRTGRLLCRRADGTVQVHLDGLAFANGVALAPDESYVCVAESAGRTVVRLWLGGLLAGTSDLLVGDLPGYPDNISTGSDGLIWVTVASPIDPVVEQLRARAPLFVRKLVTRLPEAVQPAPKRTVRAQAFDPDGRLVHDVVADPSDYHMATGVREHDGEVWFGSLHEPAVAVVSL